MGQRRIALGLALLVTMAADTGCAQLQRTGARASKLIEPMQGRRVPEPALQEPGGTSPWARAASPESEDVGAFSLAESSEVPEGAVLALRSPEDDSKPTKGRTRRRLREGRSSEPTSTKRARATVPKRIDPLESIDRTIQRAETELAGISAYRVQMKRQERVGDRLLPEELVILNIRREPLGVRLEWLDGPNKGREVLYSEQECGGMMHVKLGGTLPVPPLKLSPTSPMAMQNSRHPISEAGLDPIVADLRKQIDALRAGDLSPGTMTLERVAGKGKRKRDSIRRVGPEGSIWTVTFDEKTGLPDSLRRVDSANELIEDYEFREFEPDLAGLLTAEAFDPAKRWGAGAGFLGRLARAAQGNTTPIDRDKSVP